MNILIKNGRVIDPAYQLDAVTDLFISEDIIAGIGEQPSDFQIDKSIDATGLIVSPGLIDLSVRLREPGQEHAATIASETAAAAKGGITTVCVPPDTEPVIDNPAVVDLIEDRATLANRTSVLTVGALTQKLEGELLAEMVKLKEAGCIAFSNSTHAIKNTLIQQRAMAYAATLDMPIFIHPHDPWLRTNGCAHEGAVSTRLGLGGIPESSELIAVSRDLILIEQTGVRAHFHSLSTGKAVKLIADAQERGLPVTADVSAHHLHLTEHDIGNYDSLSHVLPPFRTIRDREQLRQGVRNGIISAISSHHQPLDKDAKLGPFAETKPGISGLETLLPLTLKLVDDEEISINHALATLTSNPADILGIDSGHLSVGAVADLCLIDPNSHYECQPMNFVSAGKNSPFKDWLFNTQVNKTLFQGRVVYQQESSY